MNNHHDPIILDHMATLAESVRSRALTLLEDQELTVSDLCAVLQLPQSTVSRHLKTLLDRGWVDSRPDGTRRLYHATVAGQDPAVQELWGLTRIEIDRSPAGRADRQRLASVLAQGRSRSREFFDASSDRWDAIRDELFGTHFYLFALVGLLPSDQIVADLGCGTGTVAEALAPFVRRVIGVDASPPMLDLAGRRLERFDNVELRHGDLESLPVETGQVDIATMILVLHLLEQPELAIREAARALRPGGQILIVDMLPHNRAEYQMEKGHVWLGFSENTIKEFLVNTGFDDVRFKLLPPAPEAKGPSLFTVSAHLRSENK
ncbi:MAG: ArsR family transcriptional regulator [Candidatus Latescibacterota bacterium]|nr:MAG: ArsR family transcriptional regulator [Candidatus Latescibacterota bacterium]